MSRVRAIETVVLLAAAILLVTATVNDLVRQAGINHRLVADLDSWRTYTGRPYRNLTISQELLGTRSKHEVVCGNTTPGPPQGRTQICLAIWGPVLAGRRTVHGGWYLPAGSEDAAKDRYGCFGDVPRRLCPQ
jgi:hypothetical protein